VRAAAEDILAAFAAELDAGARPADALRAAALSGDGVPAPPAGADRTTLAGELAAHTDPAVALAGCEAPALRQLAVAYRVCRSAGIRLAPVATTLAGQARADAVRAGELTAALAGPRSSGRLVAALPVIGVALGALLGAAPQHILLHTAAGAACLAAGGLLDLAGLRWLGRLADGVERRSGR
jgi:tight adherence protein B